MGGKQGDDTSTLGSDLYAGQTLFLGGGLKVLHLQIMNPVLLKKWGGKLISA